MPHADYLQDVFVFLAAAVIMVPLFQKAKLGAVLGFLVAGVAVGPFGLGLIDNVEEPGRSPSWAWCSCSASSGWN